ncbi:MAG: AbrB/MazE/SpoVT family DNA-binding domain-containing protein [Nitrososphaeraceae archaeon]
MYTSSITMGETTALSLNNKNKASLKTTVPMFIVKQWNLKAGEEVEWALEVCKDGELVATVRKVSTRKSKK